MVVPRRGPLQVVPLGPAPWVGSSLLILLLSPLATAPTAVVSPTVPVFGSTSAPVGLMVAVKPDDGGDESSVDKFWWYGDDEGVDYKFYRSVFNSFLSCSCILTESVPTFASSFGLVRCGSLSISTTSGDDIVLPLDLVSSLFQAIAPAGDLNHLVVEDMALLLRTWA